MRAGFADPVLDAQRTFRAVLDALSRPGTARPLRCDLSPPEPLTPELAVIALTLADVDAPIWLDPVLAASPEVAAYLRFHTGAAIVADPAEAAFGLVADPARLPEFGRFAPGLPAYPDRSATLVVAVPGLAGGPPLRLAGPGIDGIAGSAPRGLPTDIAVRLAANHALAPLGIDLLLVAPGCVAGLPRSTRVEAARPAQPDRQQPDRQQPDREAA